MGGMDVVGEISIVVVCGPLDVVPKGVESAVVIVDKRGSADRVRGIERTEMNVLVELVDRDITDGVNFEVE